MSLNLIMGARNNAKNKREENDFYATHPSAIKTFLNKLNEDKVELSKNIWECACGKGHISEVLKSQGFIVKSSDLINRGYGEQKDFLQNTEQINCDVITNPPFKKALEFAYKALDFMVLGRKLCLFLKIQFLESKERKKLFEKYPPKYIYVYSERQQCSMNGDFENLNAKTQAYIWVIWEKVFKVKQ